MLTVSTMLVLFSSILVPAGVHLRDEWRRVEIKDALRR